MELWPDGRTQRQSANDGTPSWHLDDEVDPDRVIKEVVGDCQTFFEDGAPQPGRFSRNAK